jgi:hypothetical protein
MAKDTDMDLGPLLISRLQFAFTIIFHIIFPTFTIGLSTYNATLCVMWMRSGKEHYRLLARFWTTIFALPGVPEKLDPFRTHCAMAQAPTEQSGP